jgi:hypothetical protein
MSKTRKLAYRGKVTRVALKIEIRRTGRKVSLLGNLREKPGLGIL